MLLDAGGLAVFGQKSVFASATALQRFVAPCTVVLSCVRAHCGAAACAVHVSCPRAAFLRSTWVCLFPGRPWLADINGRPALRLLPHPCAALHCVPYCSSPSARCVPYALPSAPLRCLELRCSCDPLGAALSAPLALLCRSARDTRTNGLTEWALGCKQAAPRTSAREGPQGSQTRQHHSQTPAKRRHSGPRQPRRRQQSSTGGHRAETARAGAPTRDQPARPNQPQRMGQQTNPGTAPAWLAMHPNLTHTHENRGPHEQARAAPRPPHAPPRATTATPRRAAPRRRRDRRPRSGVGHRPPAAQRQPRSYGRPAASIICSAAAIACAPVAYVYCCTASDFQRPSTLSMH